MNQWSQKRHYKWYVGGGLEINNSKDQSFRTNLSFTWIFALCDGFP